MEIVKDIAVNIKVKNPEVLEDIKDCVSEIADTTERLEKLICCINFQADVEEPIN